MDEAAHEEESDTGDVPLLNASPSTPSAPSEATHGVALRLKRQRAKRLAGVFKRSEKAYDEMRHTNVSLMHDGASVETKRRLVRCVGCFKTRALVHGLALTKIPSVTSSSLSCFSCVSEDVNATHVHDLLMTHCVAVLLLDE